MTGRGIDQILPHPSDPTLYEPHMRSALGYVHLAEKVHGTLQRPVDFSYIWGDALALLQRMNPDLRVINLETAITRAKDAWPDKGIHYRMHPANIPCLAAAGIHCCTLANNHVMDWGHEGLSETLRSLQEAGIATSGAGRDAAEASAPAILNVSAKGRVLIYAWGTEDSGIPANWAATENKPGVNLLTDLSRPNLEAVASHVHSLKRPGDTVVASLHWGENWGWGVTTAQRAFAHGLIDTAGVDLVYGHSSHHVKGIEVHHGKCILYGCGDFLNDYEGIGGHEQFRGDLGSMYFPILDNGRLTRLVLLPTKIQNFQVHRACESGIRWLLETLNRESERFGTQILRGEDDSLLIY